MEGIRRQCPEGFDVETHFNPHYNPWDERLCACPGGDFFKALRRKQADVVTGHIESFTSTGIRLQDGRELPADLVVTATGFHMQSNFPVNDIAVTVDGEAYDSASKVLYKDMMLGDMPNFFFVLGYLQESLTLKAELVAGYVTRIINHMDTHKYTQCTPTGAQAVEGIEFLGLKSSYLKRSANRLPAQAQNPGWNLYGTYAPDLLTLSTRNVDDGHLAFAKAAKARL
jgi:monooxygenase